MIKKRKTVMKKKKIKQMKCDYPEIVAKLSLLVGAGMTVRMAWEKIVVDYRVRQKSGSKNVMHMSSCQKDLICLNQANRRFMFMKNLV